MEIEFARRERHLRFKDGLAKVQIGAFRDEVLLKKNKYFKKCN